MRRLATLTSILTFVSVPMVQAQNASPSQPHVMPPSDVSCQMSIGDGFENLQIETSDIALHERFFEHVLHASLIQRLDHPQTDHIRAYCYRGVLVVIRHDLRTPRPTGWVQLNFMVSNVTAVRQDVESASRTLSEEERDKVARFRMKTDVMRGNRKVDRLEVYGPEGFLVGFDQPH